MSHEKPQPQEPRDDVELVTTTYERCWQRSKGRYNSWIDGRLHPMARRFYIVVNATERCLMDGVTSLLEDARFGLAETADAFASLGFNAHAHAIHELNAVVDDRLLSHDPRVRDRQLTESLVSSADSERLNRLFPMSQAAENEVWRVLAEIIRQHPEMFSADESAT